MPHHLSVSPGALQDAVDRLPRDGKPAVIELTEGVFREKIVLDRPGTALVGAGRDRTRIVWDDGAKTILDDGLKRGTFRTATLRTDGENITLRGLTVENAAAPVEEAGQAIALYADGDGFLCEDCALIGRQDTLFTAPLPETEFEPGGFRGPKEHAPRTRQRQRYVNCRIEGCVDFIFGGAAALFECCDLVAVDGRADRSAPPRLWYAAPSTPPDQPVGYVFHRCRFLGEGVPPACAFIARPWRTGAKLALIACELSACVHPALFDAWGDREGVWGVDGPGPAPDGVRLLTDAEARALLSPEAFETALI